MKRTTLGYVLLAGFGVALATQVSGCSIVLGTTGLIIDNATAHPPRLIPADRVAYIKKGSDVSLHTADGRELTGQLLGHTRVATATYAPRYDAWRAGAADGSRYPALSESVEVVRGDGARIAGRFAGFGFRSVLLADRGDEPREQPMLEVSSLRAGERVVAGDSLIAAAMASRLPSRDALELRVWKGATDAERKSHRRTAERSSVTGSGLSVLEVPTSDVVRISVGQPGHAAITGLLIGLAMDITVLAIASSFESGWGGSSCSGVTFYSRNVTPHGAAWDPRTGRAAPRGAH